MEKKWQKRNSKLNTYSALVMHSYFNFDREFVKSNFQYNPRRRPRWAPFLMTSQTKSLHFSGSPRLLACENSRVSLLLAAWEVSQEKRNAPYGGERGETAVFADYDTPGECLVK